MRLSLATRLTAAAVALMATLAGSANGAAVRPAAAKNLRLYVIDCGVLLYNSPARFGYKPGELTPTTLTDGCYLIDDPGKGTLVWDTGVIPDHMWTPDSPPPKKEYAEGVIPLRTQLEKSAATPKT